MDVLVAREEDVPAWLILASEVEDLFESPMSTDPSFVEGIRENIARGSAFCVRTDSASLNVLAGGVLWSPARRRIGWLSVAAKFRRQGIGSALVQHVLSLAGPGTAEVVTFGADVVGGAAARAFYVKRGFVCVGPAPDVPAGWSRDLFVRST